MADDLNGGRNSLTRPALLLRDTGPLSLDLLPCDPANTRTAGLTERDYPLALTSEAIDPLHRPVRGDLAHIRYVGRIFVPHYAVPMPHRVASEAPLVRQARADAAALTVLEPGAEFNVLDMAGGWAWGQVGEHGLVGYVTLTALEAV